MPRKATNEVGAARELPSLRRCSEDAFRCELLSAASRINDNTNVRGAWSAEVSDNCCARAGGKGCLQPLQFRGDSFSSLGEPKFAGNWLRGEMKLVVIEIFTHLNRYHFKVGRRRKTRPAAHRVKLRNKVQVEGTSINQSNFETVVLSSEGPTRRYT